MGWAVNAGKAKMGLASSYLQINTFKRWERWRGDSFHTDGLVNQDTNASSMPARVWTVDELVVTWVNLLVRWASEALPCSQVPQWERMSRSVDDPKSRIHSVLAESPTDLALRHDSWRSLGLGCWCGLSISMLDRFVLLTSEWCFSKGASSPICMGTCLICGSVLLAAGLGLQRWGSVMGD